MRVPISALLVIGYALFVLVEILILYYYLR